MKLSVAILPLALAVHQASAFAPSPLRHQKLSLSFSSTSPLRMTAEDDEPEAVEPAVVEEPPAPAPASSEPSSSIVVVNQENIEFTAGILGAVIGLYLGGPYLAAIAAAAANLASKSEGNVVGTISKSGIEVFNYLVGFNAQYNVLDKASETLNKGVDKLKESDSVDPDSIEKIEEALTKAKAKVTEVNDEYDLVGAAKTALGVVGDLVEKSVETAGELNEQYDLTSKAKDALDAGISKAGASESIEQATAFLEEKKAVVTDKLNEVIPAATEEETTPEE